VLANQFHDQSKKQLGYTTAYKYISVISTSLPTLLNLLTAKQALLQESIQVVNGELTKNLLNQQKTQLQTMKTKLTTQLGETQRNIDRLSMYIQNFGGRKYPNDIQGLLLPQLFL